jgi:hypothetical protein
MSVETTFIFFWPTLASVLAWVIAVRWLRQHDDRSDLADHAALTFPAITSAPDARLKSRQPHE